MSLAKKKVRVVIAGVSIAIIGFFIFKVIEKSMSEAEAGETVYSDKPKAQEPITMLPDAILDCLRWIKGNDGKNYCVIGG